jgi:hypothetical protein
MENEEDFENRVHLDPELTWKDAAEGIYDAVKEGKCSKEDVLKFFEISAQEIYEPRINRIFAKVLGTFFQHSFTDKKIHGVLVVVDGKQWIVRAENGEIISEGPVKYDCPDRSFLVLHESEADAKIDAWERGERYITEIEEN